MTGFLMFGCAKPANLMSYRSLNSANVHKQMDYALLVPPMGENEDPNRFPVILLLHGMGEDHTALDHFGVSESLLAGMKDGSIPKAFIILPNGERGMYVNWADDSMRWEDYIIKEVLPAAEKELGLTVTRDRRHIVGVSAGGAGAVQIGFKHPELFASVTNLSGPILSREMGKKLAGSLFIRLLVPVERIYGDENSTHMDQYDTYALVKNWNGEQRQRIYLAVGDDEREMLLDTHEKFSQFLDAQGITHRRVIYEGGHGWKYWKDVMGDIVRFICE